MEIEGFFLKQDKGLASKPTPAHSQLPAVRAAYGVFSAGSCGTFCGRFRNGRHLNSLDSRRCKGLKCALLRFGGIMSKNENRLNFRMTDEAASK